MNIFYQPEEQHKPSCIVRLSRSTYKRGSRFISETSISWLKSKSELSIYDITDLEDVFDIINIEECEDGLYNLVACNFSRDYESGMIDDWDVKLIPYQEG